MILPAVKREMERQRLSVSALAKVAKVPRPNLSAWLNGRGELRGDSLERIMTALGLKVSSPSAAGRGRVNRP